MWNRSDVGARAEASCGACFLAAELDRPAGLAEMPLARAQLEGYVLSSLLYAGRHQFSAGLADPHNVRRMGRLAPVLQYIEANADGDLTPDILARVAGVSVRTLHAAFHEQRGESPMAYVRRVRLGRVRAELLRSDPANSSTNCRRSRCTGNLPSSVHPSPRAFPRSAENG